MPRIKFSLGVSPDNAGAYSDEIEQIIIDNASQKDVCAIGSCGLDTTCDEVQIEAFRRQIRLARQLGLPLVVKAAGALGQAREVLVEEGVPEKGVLLRAFGAGDDDARQDGSLLADELSAWCALGAYVSFDAHAANDPVAFAELARQVPQDRIMVESGATTCGVDELSGFDPRCDQVVFVADALLGVVTSSQLAINHQILFGF